jgi:serine protease Do
MAIQGIALALLGAALVFDEPAQNRPATESTREVKLLSAGDDPAREAKFFGDVAFPLTNPYHAVAGQEQLLGQWIAANPMQEDLSLAAADESLRDQLHLPEGQGLVVIAVAPGGQAAQAGLAANDILLTLGDRPLAKPEDLDASLKDGDKPRELKVLRAGKPTTLRVRPLYRVTLAPAESASASYYIGVPANPVDETLRSHLGLPDGQGLIVTDVVPDSPAAKAGLQKNDILLKLGDKPLTDVDSLVAQIQAVGGKAAPLEVIRGGKPRTISITPERRKAEPEARAWKALSSPYHFVRPNKAQEAAATFYFTPYFNPTDPNHAASLRWLTTKPPGQAAPDDLKTRLDELSKQVQALQKSVEEMRKSMK